MNEGYNNSTGNYGELMARLMQERARYSSDEEFKAYAIASVRRFINDLRGLSIEVSMRPNYLETPPAPHSVSPKLMN